MRNSHFKPIFNACHQVQFKENLMNRFREKFKIVDLRPKMTHFSHSGHNKNFSWKSKTPTFYFLVSVIRYKFKKSNKKS